MYLKRVCNSYRFSHYIAQTQKRLLLSPIVVRFKNCVKIWEYTLHHRLRRIDWDHDGKHLVLEPEQAFLPYRILIELQKRINELIFFSDVKGKIYPRVDSNCHGWVFSIHYISIAKQRCSLYERGSEKRRKHF